MGVEKFGEKIIKGIEEARKEIKRKINWAISTLQTMFKFPEPEEKFPLITGKPSFFERIRGKGKFYDKLSYVILKVLRDECPKRGGVITLSDIVLLINRGREDDPLTPETILTALKNLEKKNVIPRIKTLPSGAKIVSFSPVELSNDHWTVLDLASSKGWVTLEEIILKTGWSTEKAQMVLEDLERTGIAVRDVKYERGLRWYFPSFANKTKLKGE